MNRLFIVSSTNSRTIYYSQKSLRFKSKPFFHSIIMSLVALGLVCCHSFAVNAQEREREPMELSVVVVNPSKTKTQTVPIKMYLPMEVTPDSILDTDGLDVEFDSDKSMYYLYKEQVELKPSETKNFNVEIKDVWIIPQGRLDSLRDQAQSVINRLEGSEFYDSSKELGETINKALETVAVTQDDEAVSRRSHIGIYRNNTKIVGQIKEDIEWLEKQLSVVMSLPKPDVLERSKLKTESPTKSTTWMIIFIIMIFIGMLAGVFFFTWQVQAKATKNLISDARDSAFPERENSEDKEA